MATWTDPLCKMGCLLRHCKISVHLKEVQPLSNKLCHVNVAAKCKSVMLGHEYLLLLLLLLLLLTAAAAFCLDLIYRLYCHAIRSCTSSVSCLLSLSSCLRHTAVHMSDLTLPLGNALWVCVECYSNLHLHAHRMAEATPLVYAGPAVVEL